ncbi:DUF3616 domain-containing protein [Paraurantiacibacter namhicola]|uniref:DUF3616 domain-containing protein n=1 Tax=Paraurantiacibacter namhicola TaxID=645517 RepID=A0A1C7DAG1_9SPHN|nr:DUF3616 domain-containing protein [Paraurantiacibacter namhicola]ANU08301.1 hypothetical protein A6F65_02012 [Paraurantiacibacter namhicola]
MSVNILAPQPFTKTDNLPAPREPVGHIKLSFGGDASEDDEHPLWDISACGVIGQTLFVAGDEAHGVERLTPAQHGWLGDHKAFHLHDFVELRDPEEEMDIEGMAISDNWLWVTGSHSRTRPDPRDDGDTPDCIDIAHIADLKDTRPRCVLARIPLLFDEEGHAIPVKDDGDRHAGLVRQRKDQGSKLKRYLAKHPLLGPSCALAAKEGGLDIEGIAVKAERVALGLRGPTIQTFAVLVEPQIEPKKSGKLHLPSAPMIRLCDLGGLGIRDLLASDDGDDLLILAGPTQDLDGRCAIYRWKDWANEPPEHEETVRLHRPERLFDLPVKLDADHPEGIEYWTGEDGETKLLVLYDSPNPDRIDAEKATILGDLFDLD